MKLSQYLSAEGLSLSAFAERAGLQVSTVHRAAHGTVMPSERTMRAIIGASNGAVRADDFFSVANDPANPGVTEVVDEEDILRSQLYALLARLLSTPPDGAGLRAVGALSGDETALGQSIAALAAVASAKTPAEARTEFEALFIGMTRGELVPYASYYLTGFLHEKPLARLRGDMARLGIVRAENVSEPEDHIAAICEIMAGLITGGFGQPVDLAGQQRFFEDHVGCWAPRFFEDLIAAPSASLYGPVGAIGRHFMAIERDAFAMAA